MGEYRVEKLDKQGFSLLIPLMKDAFGRDADIGYFEWKYLQNPAGEFVGFIAVADDGDVGAYYGVIPERYVIDGVSTIIFQSCDTMTHSKHRRRGLFQKLATHCYDHLRDEGRLFIIGFGGDQSTPGFLKFGWRQPFMIGYQFYPRAFALLDFAGDSPDVHEVTDFGLLASAATMSNQQARIRSDRTAEVVKWRLANPRHSYKALAIKSGNAYVSYLVYYIEDGKFLLFDFYFQNRDHGKSLIGQLKRKLKSSDSRGILCFAQKDSSYARDLAQRGFLRNPFHRGPLSAKVPFIFYSTPEKMDDFMKPSHWAINAFDHDAL